MTIKEQGETARSQQEDRTWQHDIAMREHGKLGVAEIDGIVKLLLAHKDGELRKLEIAANREEAENAASASNGKG